MDNDSLCVYSLNVNGLGDSVKRQAVLSKLKQKGPGIFMLQETHSTVSTEKSWKTQWGSDKIIFSHGTSNSKGVAILFSQDYHDISLEKVYTDDEGRYILIDMLFSDKKYTICNLYAPTRNHEQDQINVLNSFIDNIQKFEMINTICGGDYNVYLNPRLDKLDTMPDTNDNPIYRQNIISYLDTYSLVDIWRYLNPMLKFFTWHRGKSKSRLDYLFISEHLLNTVTKCDILPGIHSDHSLLHLIVGVNHTENRGKGFWKFNSSLIHDSEYVKNLKNIIKQAGDKYDYIEDKRVKWELIKLEIRSYTLPYTINKKKKLCKLEKDLNNRYIELHSKVLANNNTDDEFEEFTSVKNELESIEKHKARGVMLRSKCKWVEEGEKNTSYFLRLEQHNFSNKLISQILVDNNLITDPTEILKAERQFYENLYKNPHENNDDLFERNAEIFTTDSNIPKISEDDKIKCEEYVTENELLKSVKLLRNKKSPGSDGLTTEFYKFFWIDIKTFLTDSINYSLEHGELSIEQRRGIITLIPKKDKDRLLLKNWRPITLLNVDYKILAKALSNRLCSILPYIINEDQTGYLQGRFIGCNIRLIEDLIIYTHQNNMPGIILTIDFEKAFDSISWKFIDYSLKAFNFGPKFRKFISTLYANIQTSVINNGEISEWFYPARGVRQGCPISPYLFLIAVELLAINIRENKNIKGLTIMDTEIKISQLADDTTIFVQDIESIEQVLLTFDQYRLCAGLKLNIDKTKAKYLGSLKDEKGSPFGLDWSANNINALGVIISGEEDNHYELNFRGKISNMKSLLCSWKCRKLSLKGKITVVNILALSPLLYVSSVLHVPQRVFKEVKDIVMDFLWDGKPAKIAYNTLIQDIKKGGLKLVDFETKTKSLKATWIKRLVDKNTTKWKAAALTFFKSRDMGFYFSCNNSKKKIYPLFYQDIQNVWSDVTKMKTMDPINVLNQTLWNNRYILINKKPVIWDKWIKCGITKLVHLVNEEGNFFSYTELNHVYNVNCNFLNVMQLIDSIPAEWKKVVKNYKQSCMFQPESIVVNGNFWPLSKLKSKDVYIKLITDIAWEPTCMRKWTECFPEFKNADSSLWENIFCLTFSIARETKIQSFQYRLLHRTIPCQKRLYEMKISASPKCTFCNEEDDDIIHFILYCPRVKQFWKSFFLWWNGISDFRIASDYEDIEECILFGFQPRGDTFEVLNFCILQAKYYVYIQRMYEQNNNNNNNKTFV